MSSAFFLTFAKALTAFLLLFGLGVFLAYNTVPTDVSFIHYLNLPFTAFTVPYLIFIVSWGIAYNKHHVFPNNQATLVVGVLIGASLLSAMILFESGSTEYASIDTNSLLAKIAPALLFGFFGSAFQLYFVVIVLRYWPIRFPF